MMLEVAGASGLAMALCVGELIRRKILARGSSTASTSSAASKHGGCFDIRQTSLMRSTGPSHRTADRSKGTNSERCDMKPFDQNSVKSIDSHLLRALPGLVRTPPLTQDPHTALCPGREPPIDRASRQQLTFVSFPGLKERVRRLRARFVGSPHNDISLASPKTRYTPTRTRAMTFIR